MDYMPDDPAVRILDKEEEAECQQDSPLLAATECSGSLSCDDSMPPIDQLDAPISTEQSLETVEPSEPPCVTSQDATDGSHESGISLSTLQDCLAAGRNFLRIAEETNSFCSNVISLSYK